MDGLLLGRQGFGVRYGLMFLALIPILGRPDSTVVIGHGIIIRAPRQTHKANFNKQTLPVNKIIQPVRYDALLTDNLLP